MENETRELTEAEKKAELRKELRHLKKIDSKVEDYIATSSMLTGINYSSKGVTVEQLNDLIVFITNEQLRKEREDRIKRGGII